MLKKPNKFNSKAFSLFICFLSAFCLWVYVANVEDPDMSRTVRDIPVEIVGEEELNASGWAVKSISKNTIKVKFEAKRHMFKEISTQTVKATVDVSDLESAGEHSMLISLSYPYQNAGASFSSGTDRSITVELEAYVTASFPIEAKYSKKPKNGYYVNHVALADGTMVMEASGPESYMALVDHIVTSGADLSDATGDCSPFLSLTAVDASGSPVDRIKLANKGKDVYFDIYREKTIPLTVIANPEDETVSITPSVKKVTIDGPAELVDLNEKITLEVKNAARFTDDEPKPFPIPVPDGVALAEGEPTEVILTFKSVE